MKIEVLQKNLLNSVKFFFKLKKFSELEFSLLGYFYLSIQARENLEMVKNQ